MKHDADAELLEHEVNAGLFQDEADVEPWQHEARAMAADDAKEQETKASPLGHSKG